MNPAVAAEILEEVRLIREILARITDDSRRAKELTPQEKSRRSRERFEAMMRDWQERYQ